MHKQDMRRTGRVSFGTFDLTHETDHTVNTCLYSADEVDEFSSLDFTVCGHVFCLPLTLITGTDQGCSDNLV